jgi:uncharacterized protein
MKTLAAILCVLLLQCVSAADDVFMPLDVRNVKVGGEIGRRIDVTIHNNLLVLDAEKDFLAPFKTKTLASGYIGLGKLIDAAVRLAAYSKNEKAIALKNRLIDELLRTQEPDGYIGIMTPYARLWGVWDVHEMNYIIYGLVTDYRYFGEKRSLDAARKMADYIVDRWGTMPPDWSQKMQIATYVMIIGLERSMLALHHETNDKKYLDFVVQQRALPEWNLGIVMGRRSMIEGHAYAYLCRCLAQLELYRSQPEPKLLAPTRRAMNFLTAQDGMTITGGAGQAEIWTDDQDGGHCLGETCTTAYQLRVYDNLLRLNGNPRYGDLMERAIYNALFAAQSPDGRKIRYYSPFQGNRIYFDQDGYCCPGNYRRIVAELPAFVYYRSKSGVAINLYTPSEADFRLAGDTTLKLRQETDYPSADRVTLHVDPSKPAEFPVQLRIPRWCAKASVAVNGRPIDKPIVSGEFFTIERQWSRGDKVTLDMPMTWRFVAGRKRQSGRAAVMRGPVVFCLNPTQKDVLKNQDAADLSYLTILPESVKDAPGDNSIRPGGMACEIRADNEWTGLSLGNMTIKLTEFPDPKGRCAYFRIPDITKAVPDELLGEIE